MNRTSTKDQASVIYLNTNDCIETIVGGNYRTYEWPNFPWSQYLFHQGDPGTNEYLVEHTFHAMRPITQAMLANWGPPNLINAGNFGVIAVGCNLANCTYPGLSYNANAPSIGPRKWINNMAITNLNTTLQYSTTVVGGNPGTTQVISSGYYKSDPGTFFVRAPEANSSIVITLDYVDRSVPGAWAAIAADAAYAFNGIHKLVFKPVN